MVLYSNGLTQLHKSIINAGVGGWVTEWVTGQLDHLGIMQTQSSFIGVWATTAISTIMKTTQTTTTINWV